MERDLTPVNRIFVKRTRRGQIKTHVRQHYLRDDLPTGCPQLDTPDLEPRLSASAARYLVLDTNVVLYSCEHGLLTSASPEQKHGQRHHQSQ